MILLPIGRDKSTIQRHAWVSYSIIAANFIVLLISGVAFNIYRHEAQDAVGTAVTFVRNHPYLSIPPAFSALLPDEVEDEIKNTTQETPIRWLREREQAQLDKLAAAAVAAWKRLPPYRFGYIAAENRLMTLVTSMFLHAGLLHLLGNMLFFFLSGPFVEDVYGRVVFASLYFTGGLAAIFAFWMRHPQGTTPLVGASGAIAAVMGAYLVRFATSKIEFLFLALWIRPVRFFVPAFVVLPLWFGQQYLEMRSEAASGVAFSAHVGGFAYGVAIALVIRFTRLEERHVAPKIQAEIAWNMDPRLDRAMAAQHAGDLAMARSEIAALIRDRPNDVDALRTAVSIARDSEDTDLLDQYNARLFTLVQTKETDEAVDMVRTLLLERDVRAHYRLAAKAAAFCEANRHYDWALLLYEKLVKVDPWTVSAVGSMIKISNLRKWKGDVDGAREILHEARAHPASDADIKKLIEERLTTL